MVLVVVLALVLLIALLAVYIIIERNRQKARELERRLFNTRIKEVQQRFSSALNEYVEARILRPKNTTPLNSICSNFFVVQSKNHENLEYLEYLSDRILQTFQSELTKADARKDIEGLRERMQLLIAEIPRRGIEFNYAFYHEILPSLITQLVSRDLSAQELLELQHAELTLCADDNAAEDEKTAHIA
ncbi:hypothetical protein [Pseudoalteromonas pernae]|uniref:hypothetical protein n=1 Tax=Pseudoalteromonas pernae TaxID=3118054 RepID=UPI00324270A3